MTYHQLHPNRQQFPRPIPIRPHGAWYVAPGVTAGASLACAAIAGLVWFGVRLNRAIDTDGVQGEHWDDYQGTVDLWLVLAAVTAVLATAGFVGLATARGRNRRACTPPMPMSMPMGTYPR